MATKREINNSEDEIELRGGTVKKKIEIKKFKSSTRQTGTIDKTKFSIFGEVLDKKKNCGLGSDDDADPEVDLQQWRKVKLKRTTSTIKDNTIDTEIADAAANLKHKTDKKDKNNLNSIDEIADAAARLKAKRDKNRDSVKEDVTGPSKTREKSMDEHKTNEMEEIAKVAADFKANKDNLVEDIAPIKHENNMISERTAETKNQEDKTTTSFDETSVESTANMENNVPKLKKSKKSMIRQQKLKELKARIQSTELIRSISIISDHQNEVRGSASESIIFCSDDSDETWIKSPSPTTQARRRCSIDIEGNEFIFLQRTESQLQTIADEDVFFEEANKETQIRERYFSENQYDDADNDDYDESITEMPIGNGAQIVGKHQIKLPCTKTYQRKKATTNDVEENKNEGFHEKRKKGIKMLDDVEDSGKGRIKLFKYDRDAEEDVDWSLYDRVKTNADNEKQKYKALHFNDSISPDKVRNMKSDKDIQEKIDWSIHETAKANQEENNADVNQLEDEKDFIQKHQRRKFREKRDSKEDMDWEKYENVSENLTENQKVNAELAQTKDNPDSVHQNPRRFMKKSEMEEDIDWSLYETTKSLENDYALQSFHDQNKSRASEKDIEENLDRSKNERQETKLKSSQSSEKDSFKVQNYSGLESQNTLEHKKYKGKHELDEYEKGGRSLNGKQIKYETKLSKDGNEFKQEPNVFKPFDGKSQSSIRKSTNNNEVAKLNNKTDHKVETEEINTFEKRKLNRNKKEMLDEDALDRRLTLNRKEKSDDPGRIREAKLSQSKKQRMMTPKHVDDDSTTSITKLTLKAEKIKVDTNLAPHAYEDKSSHNIVEEIYIGWNLIASGNEFPSSYQHYSVEVKRGKEYTERENWVLIARGYEDYKPKITDWVSIAQGSDILESGPESINKYKRWSMDLNDINIDEPGQQLDSNDRRLWDMAYMPISKRDIFHDYFPQETQTHYSERR